MDKETFSYLVSSPEDISVAEVRNLETLAAQYPYCQLTHSLLAKGYHIHFSESQYSGKIREAAAHALSRNALRKLVNGTFVNQRTAAASVGTYRSEYANIKIVAPQPPKGELVASELIEAKIATEIQPVVEDKVEEVVAEIQPVVEDKVKEVVEAPQLPEGELASVLVDEKIADVIQPVIENKVEEVVAEVQPIEEITYRPIIGKTAEVITEVQPVEESISTSILDNVEEVVEVQQPSTVVDNPSLTPPLGRFDVSTGGLLNEVLAEIQPVEEVEPHILEFKNEIDSTLPTDETPPLGTGGHQTDIIDKFIQTDPGRIKMTKATGENEAFEDLAERSSAKPKALNLVTESFAKIMVMQGRYDKAIEIYQKLMLKFPEKSTYFAEKMAEIS